MRYQALVLAMVHMSAGFELAPGTIYDSNCVASMCADQLQKCDDDAGPLGFGQLKASHCRTLVNCIQFQQSSGKDISICTERIPSSLTSHAEQNLRQCVVDNQCLKPPTGPRPALTPAAIVKKLDHNSLLDSCKAAIQSCDKDPICKAVGECMLLTSSSATDLAGCTSHLNSLSGPLKGLFDCGQQQQAMQVDVPKAGPPSSFFQIAAQPKAVKPKVEEPHWKRMRRATEQKLADVHKSLQATLARMKGSLAEEKKQLSALKEEEKRQQNRQEKQRKFVQDALASIPDNLNPSFLEMNADWVNNRFKAAAEADAKLLAESQTRLSELTKRMGSAMDGLNSHHSFLQTEDNSSYGEKAKRALAQLKKVLAEQSDKLKKAGVQ